VSVFADGTWLADNRPAGVKGTVAPGATYKFTFDFEKAGETTVAVPISAGEAPQREAAAEPGDTGAHH